MRTAAKTSVERQDIFLFLRLQFSSLKSESRLIMEKNLKEEVKVNSNALLIHKGPGVDSYRLEEKFVTEYFISKRSKLQYQMLRQLQKFYL